MSVDPIPSPARSGAFIHPLLRARDWQDRPEFGELCQWWRAGGVGVCALVGIGGAGKTAIAERFLQVLPGGYPEHPRVPKNRGLEAPSRLFVFSFYDAPNPDKFFIELAAWLEDCLAVEAVTELPSYQQTLDLLARTGTCLLVLDGLEKVQDDGLRGGAFGQILDGRLRDFVLRAADGWLPQVSVLITSRFRLYDPVAERAGYYEQIEVERLEPSVAVRLLRDRGVRGTDEELERVAREQGFHALSVDLVGGYIAYFCGGDSKGFISVTPAQRVPMDIAELAVDPRIVAIQEQERKFARLAERYQKALAVLDPAALALLQRICLFRLGVEAKTLASIFIGGGKERISGSMLAGISERQLKAKLQLLVEMRLVEARDLQVPGLRSQIYTVHPAVRDGFLSGLDAETARLGHDAARKGLEASLGGQPGEYPSDPGTLDLLEEIVYHTLAAGHAEQAWDIFWYKIGANRNLSRRLGAYDRGERICRAFVGGQSPQAAPLPAGLSESDQAFFINEWAVFLTALGQLAAAIRCYERNVELRLRQKHEGRKASVGFLNLGIVHVLSGHLGSALGAAERALQVATDDSADKIIDSLALRGFVRGLLGEPKIALTDFADAFKKGWKPSRWSWDMLGIAYAIFLGVIGRNAEATRLAEKHLEVLETELPEGAAVANCRLTLAELAYEKDDLAVAQRWLHTAHEWALQRDAMRTLCWAALIRAKIALKEFDRQSSAGQAEAQVSRGQSALAVEEGLRIARQCGYGIYHIDLLLVRAQLAINEGRAAAAERDVRVALEEGVRASVETGYPELLAATDPECLYLWGIAEGRHLLGEAFLLQAAQKLGHTEFAPKRLDRLPVEVRNLVGRAREQLNQALELWRKLKNPESEAEINPRGGRTRRVLEGLDGGILTEYPIVPIAEPTREVTPKGVPQKPAMPAPAPSVFVCYAQADNEPPKGWLNRLLVHLSALDQGDLAVWSDQQLKIGDEWNPEIQQQLVAAKVAVLLVSPAFLVSKYIANSELPVLLRRRREDGLAILPVLISPSLFHRKRFKWPDPKVGPEEFTLSSLQAAGSPRKTLSEMRGPQRNRAFVALAERILEIVGVKA